MYRNNIKLAMIHLSQDVHLLVWLIIYVEKYVELMLKMFNKKTWYFIHDIVDKLA